MSTYFHPDRPPYEHQSEAFNFCDDRAFYMLSMEQGTGKTPVGANDLARRWERKQIDTAIVMAPNGVHINWTRRELPKHMPPWVQYRAQPYVAGAGKRAKRQLEAILEPGNGELRILTANVEALSNKAGQEFLREFARTRRVGLHLKLDESQRFMNPKAKRTSNLMKILRPMAKSRSCMSGTPILGKPFHAFGQYEFLDGSILECGSNYTAFKAEYAEMLPSTHGVLRHIDARRRVKLMRQFNGNEEKVDEFLAKYTSQIVARDPITGMPKWRNLERLDALLAPHSFRVLKADCLDLPEKVYDRRYYDMNPSQAAVYLRCQEELRLQLLDGTIQPVQRLPAMNKLAQICSGYFLVPGTSIPQWVVPAEKNPKLAILAEELETCLQAGEQVIVWARFHEEMHSIAALLRGMKNEDDSPVTWAEYHGEIGSKIARQQAIDDFESGKAQVFLSNQAAGGTGLTLIAAASLARSMSVLYYSNDFSLENRLQSEDRAHRIGQEKSVRYVDFVAQNSIEEDVLNNLENKVEVADIVNGDARRATEALLNFDRE